MGVKVGLGAHSPTIRQLQNAVTPNDWDPGSSPARSPAAQQSTGCAIGQLEEEPAAAGLVLLLGQPLELPVAAVEGALLQAEQLEGEAGTELLRIQTDGKCRAGYGRRGHGGAGQRRVLGPELFAGLPYQVAGLLQQPHHANAS